MTKKDDSPGKPRTHFDQVPVDIVKKIAKEDLAPGNKRGASGASRKPLVRKTK